MIDNGFRVLEDACKDDAELRAVLGDSIGNPELMRKRVFFFHFACLWHCVEYFAYLTYMRQSEKMVGVDLMYALSSRELVSIPSKAVSEWLS